MIGIALWISFFLVAMAIVLNAYRLLVGPSLPDRIIALDTMYVNSIALTVHDLAQHPRLF